MTATDPCCGSGGFFLAAQEFISNPDNYTLDREQKEFLKNKTFHGNEFVAETFKMALMNLYLHNIGDIYGNVPIVQGDSLLTFEMLDSRIEVKNTVDLLREVYYGSTPQKEIGAAYI